MSSIVVHASLSFKGLRVSSTSQSSGFYGDRLSLSKNEFNRGSSIFIVQASASVIHFTVIWILWRPTIVIEKTSSIVVQASSSSSVCECHPLQLYLDFDGISLTDLYVRAYFAVIFPNNWISLSAGGVQGGGGNSWMKWEGLVKHVRDQSVNVTTIMVR